jgi:ribose transport system substrate-binding protein
MSRILSATLLVAAIFAAACSPKTADDGKLTIAVIPVGTTHSFWKTVEAGALKAGEEEGVEVIWKGAVREDSREEQIKIIEDFIAKGVDGIVLAPMDDVAIRRSVSEAIDEGIPVVLFGTGLQDETGTVSFVATDNFQAGRMAGERLAELVGETGRIVLLRYSEGNASTTQREEGFLAAIADHPGLTVLSSDQFAGVTAETAQTKAENLIGRFRSSDDPGFDGIFAPNEPSAFGTMRAIQDAGLADQVHFVGFDSSDGLLAGIEDGSVKALVVQDPHNIGYLGALTMIKHLKGEDVEKRIDTGATITDAASFINPGE